MKKIITLLLLLIFCIEPTCWATEIIVGANGQARYAGEAATPIKTETVIKKEDSKQMKSSTTKKTEENLKDMDSYGVTQKELIQKIKAYENVNKDIISKAEKNIDYQKAYNNISWLQDNKNNSYVKTFQLQDGDYALWKPTDSNVQYAGEYHQNGSCMGVIKIKKLNKNTVVFYEYRSESTALKTAPLKHIMIAHNDKHKAVFVYNSENKLRCCQYEDKTYAIDMNMPVEVMKPIGARKSAFNIAGEALMYTAFVVIVLPILFWAWSTSSESYTH